uniref:DRBM domain-containing protein n=1 Tax=Strigamia maritima TaxID=126957 RepID=T1ITP3_STRMM
MMCTMPVPQAVLKIKYSSPNMLPPTYWNLGSGMIVGMAVNPSPSTPTLNLGGAPTMVESMSLPMGPGHIPTNPGGQSIVLSGPAAALVSENIPNTSNNVTCNSLTNGSGELHNLINTTSSSCIQNVANTKEKTPMCLINELARYNKIQHQYRLTDESGPAHKKTFSVALRLGEEEYTAAGPSIKKAQHATAALALEKTNFKHPPPKAQRQQLRMGPGIFNYHLMEGPYYNGNITPTVELNALAMKRGEPAIYKFLEPYRPPYMAPNFNFRGMYHQRYHYHRTPQMFYISLTVGNREFVGEGRTAQAARHNAAAKALKMLRELPLPESAAPQEVEEEIAINGNDENVDPNAELKSPISLVHEIALKRNFSVGFEVVRESGPPHMRTFITKCIVGEMVTEGEGNGKKISKKRAAEKMLEDLKTLPLLPPTMQRVKKKTPTVKKKSRNLIKVSDTTVR